MPLPGLQFRAGSNALRFNNHTAGPTPALAKLPANRYHDSVAIVRILIDGYSLLHSWPELAPGKPRFSAAAREELIHWIRQYRDATSTAITIIFDGAGAPPGTPKATSTPELEILYSSAGQTADEMIERAAHRLRDYGEVLVVTDDYAERDTVHSFGGLASTCAHFIAGIHEVLGTFDRDLKRHNEKELARFKSKRNS
jgi:ribosomal protection tetracycline resistance protein